MSVHEYKVERFYFGPDHEDKSIEDHRFNSINFSDDGNLMVMTSKSGLVAVSDVTNRLQVMKSRCFSLSKRHQQSQIARLWSTNIINLVYAITSEERDPISDSSLKNNSIKLLDLNRTNQVKISYLGHQSKIISLAANKALPLLASTDIDGKYIIWDERSNHPQYQTHDSSFKNCLVTWSNCGQTFCSSYTDKHDDSILAIFDLKNLSTPIQTEKVFDNYKISSGTRKTRFITDIQYSPMNDSILVTTGHDRILLYDSLDLDKKPSSFNGHQNFAGQSKVRIGFSAGLLEDQIICGGDDKKLHRFSRKTGDKLEEYQLKQNVKKIEVNPTYDIFATINSDDSLQIWVQNSDGS